MVSCPLVNPKAENNKTANVVLPDLVHRLYQSMIFLWRTNKRNLIYAHNKSKYGLSCTDFHKLTNAQQHYITYTKFHPIRQYEWKV